MSKKKKPPSKRDQKEEDQERQSPAEKKKAERQEIQNWILAVSRAIVAAVVSIHATARGRDVRQEEVQSSCLKYYAMCKGKTR